MRVSIPCFIALLLAGTLQAQESESPFTFTGYADVYYGYDFSQPLNSSRQYVTQAARHSEFNLNWGYVLAEYAGDRVRSSLGFHTGTYVQTNYAAEPNDLTRMIYQANAGVRLGKAVWVDAGIITPHSGYEGAASLDNEIYTRALATEFTPYYLTGVKLSAPLGEKADLTAVVVNGWQLIAETNTGKSVGVNLQYRPIEPLTLSYGNLIGDEAPRLLVAGMEAKVRNYHNLWAKYDLTQQTHVVLSLDYGTQELLNSQEKGRFTSWMAIVNHDIGDKASVAVRMENFTDGDEIIVNATNADEFDLTTASITGTYKVTPDAFLRLEAKAGEASRSIFRTEEGGNTGKFFLLAGSLAIRFTKQAGRN